MNINEKAYQVYSPNGLKLPCSFFGHLKKMGQSYIWDLNHGLLLPCYPSHLRTASALRLGNSCRIQIVELPKKNDSYDAKKMFAK